MKLTKEEKARLKALLLKKELDDAETKELATLKTKAAEAGYKFNAETGDELQDEPMNPDEVKSLVTEGVAGAMKELGLDADTVKAIKDSLSGDKEVTAASIKAAIKDAVGGANIDGKALAKILEDKLPKDAVTTEQVKALFADFQKEIQENTRRASKMQFSDDTFAPIESRGGNLTVAQKQLLNICVKGISDEALAMSDGRRGIKRPTGINDGISEEQLRDAARAGEMHLASMRKSAIMGGKVLTTGGSGTGAEFVPTDLSSDLQARMYLASELATAMIANEIQMPTNPFKFPLVTGRPTFRKGSENPGSSPAPSDPGTGAITLDAGKLIGISQYSYEADEDSIIAILPFLQEQLGLSAGEALEEALVNGDTTSTHMDSDTHDVGATAAQKLFKGLRKLALVSTEVDGTSIATSFATGGITAGNISALRKLMLRWGVRPNELRLIVGVKGYNDIVQLDETLTAEKVGPGAARILTGVAPQIYGIPIIVSAAVREDLNATGVYDNSTKTKGSLLLMHLPSFLVGVKRGFTVETDVDKAQQLNSVIASFRRDFKAKETPSLTMPLVALAYGYDS